MNLSQPNYHGSILVLIFNKKKSEMDTEDNKIINLNALVGRARTEIQKLEI